MKLPVGKNSPVGADFETWSLYTHQAPDIIFVYHALDLHTVKIAAYYKENLGTGYLVGFFITVDAAPP
jgi:hypothetical protein